MAKHRPERNEEPAIVTAAEELHEAIEELERLSGRAAEIELPTWAAIVKGGELLQKATDAHQRFVAALTEVSNEVGRLRDRHNGCADKLSAAASRIEERRKAHDALEQRFGAIAAAAREVDELARSIPTTSGGDPTAHASAVSAALAGVRERLARAVEDTASVEAEAKQVGLSDLEKRAISVRQQLEALLGRLSVTAGPSA